MSIWDFLDSNCFQTIILIITVIATVWIFYLQKEREIQNAARMIIMQIDSINLKASSLMEIVGANIQTFNADRFWQADYVVNANDWEKYRHLFVKKLRNNEIFALNNYFDNACSIALQQKEIKEVMIEIQKQFCVKNSELTEEQMKNVKAPNVRVTTLYLSIIQLQYDKLINSRAAVPYERLKKIAKLK